MVASNTLLWVLVLALTVMVLALARQIGVLNDRVAPAGALTPTGGPKIGETTNAVQVRDLSGTDVTIGGEGKDLTTLLMFVSPTCPVCKTLVPTAMSLAKYEGFHLLFASDGDSIDAHRSLKIWELMKIDTSFLRRLGWNIGSVNYRSRCLSIRMGHSPAWGL